MCEVVRLQTLEASCSCKRNEKVTYYCWSGLVGLLLFLSSFTLSMQCAPVAFVSPLRQLQRTTPAWFFPPAFLFCLFFPTRKFQFQMQFVFFRSQSSFCRGSRFHLVLSLFLYLSSLFSVMSLPGKRGRVASIFCLAFALHASPSVLPQPRFRPQTFQPWPPGTSCAPGSSVPKASQLASLSPVPARPPPAVRARAAPHTAPLRRRWYSWILCSGKRQAWQSTGAVPPPAACPLRAPSSAFRPAWSALEE